MREYVFVMGKKEALKKKTSKQLERYFKGISNHRRIDILILLDKNESMTLDQICSDLECHQTTASEHTAKLVRSGLIYKSYKGKFVMHSLSPYGKKLLKFVKEFA